MSNQSVTNVDFLSAAKYFHILFCTLYIVKFALSQLYTLHFICCRNRHFLTVYNYGKFHIYRPSRHKTCLIR